MKKLLGLVAAAGAGYIAGVLFAPKSGKETRAEIKQTADGVKEIAAKKAAKAREVAAKKADQAKEVYYESAKKVKKGAGEISDEMGALAKQAKVSAGKVGTEAKKLGKEAKKHLGNASDSAVRTTRGVGQSISKLK